MRRLLLAGLATIPSIAQAQSQPKAQAPPEGVRIDRDVAYLEPGRAEMADRYLPTDDPGGLRRPAVAIIHDGGWTGGDKGAGREPTSAQTSRSGVMWA